MSSFPTNNPALFWDVKAPDAEKHRDFIIARALDYGCAEDVRQLLRMYTTKDIIRVLRERRGLQPATVHFWAAYYGIQLSECISLKQSLLRK